MKILRKKLLISCSIIILLPIIIILLLIVIQFDPKYDSPKYSKSIEESKTRGVFIREYQFSSKNNVIDIEAIWLERQWISTIICNGTDTNYYKIFNLIIKLNNKRKFDYWKYDLIINDSIVFGKQGYVDEINYLNQYQDIPLFVNQQILVLKKIDVFDSSRVQLKALDTILVQESR